MGLTNPAAVTNHLRCGTPDCEWGTAIEGRGLEQWEKCFRSFREHCVERHGLDPGDTERSFWFDLETRTLTLLGD